MAEPVVIPPTPTPPEGRGQILVMHNGLFCGDDSGQWAERPKVEIVVRGCVPLRNADGSPKLNDYGQPAYQDTGWVGDLQIRPEEAMALLPLWEQVQAAVYQLIQQYPDRITWTKQADPPASVPAP